MYIRVRVTPNAKKEVLERVSKDSYNITVREPAERNLANRRALDLLATHFKLPSGKLRIISGHHSPTKLISIIDEI